MFEFLFKKKVPPAHLCSECAHCDRGSSIPRCVHPRRAILNVVTGETRYPACTDRRTHSNYMGIVIVNRLCPDYTPQDDKAAVQQILREGAGAA